MLGRIMVGTLACLFLAQTSVRAQTTPPIFDVRQVKGTVTLVTNRGVAGTLLNGSKAGLDDRITTGKDASLVLDVSPLVSLWIGPETVVAISDAGPNGDRVLLTRGRCVFDVKHRQPPVSLSIYTPLGAIASEGGIALIESQPDQAGYLIVATLEGKVRLQAGGPIHQDPVTIPPAQCYDSRYRPRRSGLSATSIQTQATPPDLHKAAVQASLLIADRSEE